MSKPRLGIVSTFDDDCGIAGYTRRLTKQIAPDFDIEVFDLDQSFMRSWDTGTAAAANRMVKEFCARATTFDFVNVQLEPGTLGADKKDILNRFKWIVDSAPALSVTFHSVLQKELFDHRAFTQGMLRLEIADSFKELRAHRDRNDIATGIYGILQKAARAKTVNIIMHTRRDAQMMRYARHFPNVYDHPLAFWSEDEAAQLRATTTRADFPILENLPPDARTIGVFGFLSEYKGFDTVVRALRFLPENYHLLVFGGVHPHEIKRRERISHYVRQLLDVAAVDSSITDLRRTHLHLNVPFAEGKGRQAMAHPDNLAHRIHFLGAQTDEDFAKGMCLCDAVVMPYLEVGQTSSGAISLALDVGARIIAARNLAFLQFSRYHPNCIEWFDIGNHIELADRLRARPAFPRESRVRRYGVESNRATYRAANSHSNGKASHSHSPARPG